jgi:Type IV secretion system pilin
MLTFTKKLGIISAVFFFAWAIFSSTALAQTTDQTNTYNNYGLNNTLKVGSLNTALINNSPQQVAGTVIGAILSLLGVVFFLLVIYGGFRWMLAQGNEAEVEKAKQILTAAIIGLIIVLSAYAITRFIGSELTAS